MGGGGGSGGSFSWGFGLMGIWEGERRTFQRLEWPALMLIVAMILVVGRSGNCR